MPVIGIGGIATIDDVMEFLVAGASAVQIGTANFYDPTASVRIVDALPGRWRAGNGRGEVRSLGRCEREQYGLPECFRRAENLSCDVHCTSSTRSLFVWGR